MPSSLLRSLLLIVLTSLSGLTAVQADVYKWLDDNGKVQFTQTPPMDRPSVRIKTSSNITSTPASVPAGKADDQQPTTEGKNGHGDEGPMEVIDSEKLEQYCAQQHKSLATLENTKRISVKEGDRVRELSEAEKQARIERIRKNIATYCSKE